MKRLFVTTAIVSALAVLPALAQTATDTTQPADPAATAPATVTAPEGYESYDAMALTGQELQGSTVYDVNGDSIGEVSDFVFEMSGAAAAPDAGATASTDTTATMSTDTTAPDSTATDSAPADTTATTGTDSGASATAPDAMAATDAGVAENLAEHPTHVVLDIGGFLGIGAHTVAVPTSDLQVFRSADNDTRIYLPWTKEQMEALPEYQEGNAATYGKPMGAATN